MLRPTYREKKLSNVNFNKGEEFYNLWISWLLLLLAVFALLAAVVSLWRLGFKLVVEEQLGLAI